MFINLFSILKKKSHYRRKYLYLNGAWENGLLFVRNKWNPQRDTLIYRTLKQVVHVFTTAHHSLMELNPS
jgi:hypothetical protein